MESLSYYEQRCEDGIEKEAAVLWSFDQKYFKKDRIGYVSFKLYLPEAYGKQGVSVTGSLNDFQME